MGESLWRIAIVDSGLRAVDRTESTPATVRRFVDTGGAVAACGPIEDSTGHGTTVARVIGSARSHQAQNPVPELLIAQVLDEQGRCTAAAVAAAVRWAVAQHARLVHLSLGLAQDRPVLASAVAEAMAQGMILVAAAPARGAISFPAGYSGVIRATGDARCDPGEISCLDASEKLFGACVTHTSESGQVSRGASIGAAYLTRFIASRLAPSGGPGEIAKGLQRLAAHEGRERRSARAGRASESSHAPQARPSTSAISAISADRQSN